MLKNFCYLTIVMALGSSSVGLAQASNLVFICHKGDSYNLGEVVLTYRAQLDEPRPIDFRPLFPQLLAIIHSDPHKYMKSWNKMMFRRALFVPPMATSESDVVQWVADHDAGIGYVTKDLSINNLDTF